MIYRVKRTLSMSTILLLCFGSLALAAPPGGKGKPPKGNQPVDATAYFIGADIVSLGIIDGRLLGELINNGNFDTLIGQLVMGETITVGGDAGAGLVELNSLHSILPSNGASYDPGCSATNCLVTFDVNSGVTWTIRLDRDKQPPNRVQFKMRWVNGAGLEHHLRIGWVVQAYEGEKYPLDDIDYGVSSSSSLESATITFDSDLFRIDGDVEIPGKGKKTKTELEVFSRYGEMSDADDASWCNMGITDPSGPCVASSTIQTDLAN